MQKRINSLNARYECLIQDEQLAEDQAARRRKESQS
jgi:hypothetical protein